MFACVSELTCPLLFDRWVALSRVDLSTTQTCNKHESDNRGARWAIEGAIAIVYTLFTTVLQRQCRYLLTLHYTNKDTLLINSDSRLQRVNFTFFQVHIDLINTHDGPYEAWWTGKSSFCDRFSGLLCNKEVSHQHLNELFYYE